MPTSDHHDNEIDQMYDKMEELVDDIKGTDNVILMGDWNAVVGKQEYRGATDRFGLGQ
jgi:endonuclease/exonuclease/phosphatase family metal-dependent hydrolase